MAGHCPNISVAAIGKNAAPDKRKHLFTRVRCKQWSCEYCAHVNRVQWLMRMIRGIEASSPKFEMRLVTLTVEGSALDADAQLARIQKALPKLT